MSLVIGLETKSSLAAIWTLEILRLLLNGLLLFATLFVTNQISFSLLSFKFLSAMMTAPMPIHVIETVPVTL